MIFIHHNLFLWIGLCISLSGLLYLWKMFLRYVFILETETKMFLKFFILYLLARVFFIKISRIDSGGVVHCMESSITDGHLSESMGSGINNEHVDIITRSMPSFQEESTYHLIDNVMAGIIVSLIQTLVVTITK